MIPLNFLLITLCIISISIYVIHKLTSFLGLQLKYKALALCALLAFTVNFATILLSPYLTTRYFLLLLGLTLTAAFIVTFYNERLLQADHASESGLTDKRARQSHASVAGPLPAASAIAAADIAGTAEAIDTAAVETAEKHVVEPLPVQLAPWYTVPRLCAYTATMQFPAASTAWPVPLWLAAALQMNPAQDKRLRPTTNILQELRRISRTASTVPQHVFHAPALLHKTVAEIVHEDIENDRLLKLTVVIAKLVSLDDILDYAYEQKERHNSFNALFAYKKALVRYQSEAYAPFIAIDIINIYKENGAYREAAHVCYDALSLPAAQNQPAIRQELRRSLMYLRAIEFVLTRHHLLKMPFNRISQAHLEEIETVFQNRYMKKNHAKGRPQKNCSQADTQPLLSRLD